MSSEMPPQKKRKSTPPPTNTIADPPLYMAGFRLDGSDVSMIRLLDLKNRKHKMLFDPSVEANIYGLPPWLTIGVDDEPQFSDTYEYLLYTPRFKNPNSRPSFGYLDSVRRKLEGEASILHWKMNGSPKIIVDRHSKLTVGLLSHHMLSVVGRDEIKLNWYLTEYRSTRTDYWTSICKVRMESEPLKAARSKVKGCEKDLEKAYLNYNLAEEEAAESFVPPSRSIVNAVEKAEEALRVAKVELRAQVVKLRESNVQVFNQLLGRDTSLQPARSGWPALSIRASLAFRDFDDTLVDLSDDDAAACEGLGNLSLRVRDKWHSFPV